MRGKQVRNSFSDTHASVDHCQTCKHDHAHLLCFHRLDLVEALVQSSTPIFVLNENGDAAVSVAARLGHADIVAFLLSVGADAAAALEAALTSHPIFLETVMSVLSVATGFDLNVPLPASKLLPLVLPLLSADFKVATALMEQGARVDGPDVSYKGTGWMSPLTASLQFERQDAFDWLLQQGAAPGKADGRGLTPLYVACLARAPHSLPSTSAVSAPSVVGRQQYAWIPTPPAGACDEASDALCLHAIAALVEAGAPCNPMPSPIQGCAKSGRACLLQRWFAAMFHDAAPALGTLPISGAAVGDAVQRQNWDVAAALLDAGAPVYPDRRIDFAVQMLEADGPVSLLLKLLPPSLTPAHSERLLVACVTGDNSVALKCLLDKVASLLQPDGLRARLDASNCLRTSIHSGSAKCAMVLAQHGASLHGLRSLMTDPAQFSCSAIVSSIIPLLCKSLGAAEFIALLCSSGLPDGSAASSPLFVLSHTLHDTSDPVGIVSALLNAGMTDDINQFTLKACALGTAPVVRLLLSHQPLAELETAAASWRDSPTLTCAIHGHTDVLDILQDLSADAVSLACMRWKGIALPALSSLVCSHARSVPVPQYLMDLRDAIMDASCSADFDTLDCDDMVMPVLHVAASSLDEGFISRLLARGVRANDVHRGYTPIDAAVHAVVEAYPNLEEQCTRIVRLLLAASADAALGTNSDAGKPLNAVSASASLHGTSLLELLWPSIPAEHPRRRTVFRDALASAAASQRIASVHYLLSSGFELSPSDTIAAVIAASSVESVDSIIVSVFFAYSLSFWISVFMFSQRGS